MASSKVKGCFSLIGRNLFVLTILIFIVEICLHFFLVNTENQKMLDFASVNQLEKRGLQAIYTPHRYLGYFPTPNYKKGENKHNSMGFRGEEIKIPKDKDVFRIFCIGGSTTYTTRVKDYKKSYPYLLEENLNKEGLKVEVINSGVGNWTSFESLINFQFKILDLEPDMILIYHSINDMRNRMVHPYDAYTSDNSGRRAPLVNFEKKWYERVVEKSNILRFICVSRKIVKSNKSILHIDPMKKSFIGDDFENQVRENIYPSLNFKKHSMDKIFEINTPKYFKRNMVNIISLARLNNVEVVLSDFAFSDKFKQKILYRKELKTALIEQNELIHSIAREHDLLCLDFFDKFSDKKELFVDGVHVNEEGSRFKAQIFTDFLIKNYFKIDN